MSENVDLHIRQDMFSYSNWKWSGNWPQASFRVNISGAPTGSLNAIKVPLQPGIMLVPGLLLTMAERIRVAEMNIVTLLMK